MKETLHNINAIPKKTWNYLKINDTTITCNFPDTTATPQASSFDAIETGCSKQAHDLIAGIAGLEMLEITKDTKLKLALDSERSFQAVDILVAPDVNLDICLYVTTNQELAGHTLRFKAEKNAHINLLSYVANGDTTTYIQDLGFELAESSMLDEHHFYLSGKSTVAGHTVDCKGHSSAHTSHTRYMVQGRSALDMAYLSNLHGVNSTSDMVVSGVLEDASRKRLAMTVDLKRGAKNSSGTENETALIFGDSVVNKTIPIILCHEDEVAGSHGATIGSISAEQLDYLQSRGLIKDEIIELFASSVEQDAKTHIARWETE